MDENIVELNITIGGISKELLDVQKVLDAYREKQKSKEAIDEEAVTFITKAELVIEKAEKGDLQLTPDQIRRIKSNLVKILQRIKR
ncbi:hypothetical protein [Leptospira perdikensis]|uniref:Uncharacterized protein n=1 Tax=Leptospira perdikensis TaxID=2484948 RepID=A0A4R9JIW2_9LEPT|nr:hypothetical protein [Leptospira perdikensis]TGL44158.1 hypothetical protein EHQ49_01350 [Leptospira perdikensis]